MLIPEHPIHPPSTDTNPWDCEIPDDRGYRFQPKEGVYRVYKDQDSLEQGYSMEWPSPDLESFLADQNLLLIYLTDGPLWVRSQ